MKLKLRGEEVRLGAPLRRLSTTRSARLRMPGLGGRKDPGARGKDPNVHCQW